MKKSPPRPSAAIRSLEPYTSARMLNALDADGVYLDANEAPHTFDFPPIDLRNIRHYADDKRSLEQAFAAFIDLNEKSVLAMRGIDEVVDLAIRAFCEPKEDRILAFTPTYGGYSAAAAAHRVEFVTAPFEKDGAIDVAGAAAVGARVIFLCRPNNPTGSATPLQQVIDLASAVSDDTLIAVDEAYVEFKPGSSALKLLPDFANIVVMRTMSKAFGLAGAHVGFAVGHAQVVGAMEKIINPYPVADPSIQLALASLGPEGRSFLHERIEDNAGVRDWFVRQLTDTPGCLEVLPSETSFVAARFADAEAVYEGLRANKIFIRPLAPMYDQSGWLRFTIGTRDQMERVLEVAGALAL